MEGEVGPSTGGGEVEGGSLPEGGDVGIDGELDIVVVVRKATSK